MGSTSVSAITAADGLELVAAVDQGDELSLLTEAGAQVALDFTQPAIALENIRWCVEHGIHVVVGTSGFDDARIGKVREMTDAQPGVGVLIVPNFSIGAVLAMAFSAKAAPFFESVEIIELHHPNKIDAPSGTATRTAEMIAQTRARAGSPTLPDATTMDPLGARGAMVAGIPIHAVRARGFVASQEVLLGGDGEILTVSHDSSTRESFMPGVMASLGAVANRPGVTVGLETVLGLY